MTCVSKCCLFTIVLKQCKQQFDRLQNAALDVCLAKIGPKYIFDYMKKS